MEFRSSRSFRSSNHLKDNENHYHNGNGRVMEVSSSLKSKWKLKHNTTNTTITNNNTTKFFTTLVSLSSASLLSKRRRQKKKQNKGKDFVLLEGRKFIIIIMALFGTIATLLSGTLLVTNYVFFSSGDYKNHFQSQKLSSSPFCVAYAISSRTPLSAQTSPFKPRKFGFSSTSTSTTIATTGVTVRERMGTEHKQARCYVLTAHNSKDQQPDYISNSEEETFASDTNPMHRGLYGTDKTFSSHG